MYKYLQLLIYYISCHAPHIYNIIICLISNRHHNLLEYKVLPKMVIPGWDSNAWVFNVAEGH